MLRKRAEPDEVLVLPSGADTGDLEDHDAIVLKEVVDLLEELRVAPDSDVL